MSLLVKPRGARPYLIWGRDFVGEEDFYCQASLPSCGLWHQEPSRESTATWLRGGSRFHHCSHPKQAAITAGRTVEAARARDAMPCANPGCASQSHWGLPHVKRGSGGLAPEPVVLSDLPAREPPNWPSSSECTKCCRSRVDLPGVDGPWEAWSSLPVASPAMQKWVRSLCFTCGPRGINISMLNNCSEKVTK